MYGIIKSNGHDVTTNEFSVEVCNFYCILARGRNEVLRSNTVSSSCAWRSVSLVLGLSATVGSLSELSSCYL